MSAASSRDRVVCLGFLVQNLWSECGMHCCVSLKDGEYLIWCRYVISFIVFILYKRKIRLHINKSKVNHHDRKKEQSRQEVWVP